MATYPYLPKLECFQDRTLYFSLLPQDILQYCIRPFLVHYLPFPRLPCGEKWIEPILVRTISLPEGANYRNSALLANGNILTTCNTVSCLQMIDFTSGQTLWQANDLTFRSMAYDESRDGLSFRWGRGEEVVCYLLLNFSQIRTAEEFRSALINPLPEEMCETIRAEWDSTNQPMFPEFQDKLSQLVNSPPINTTPFERCIYSGGYVMIVRQDHVHSGRCRFEFYQCLD